MTLIEYLNTKYPSGNFGLMSAEAKVFRIKYPLQTGWLQKHQNDAITPLQIRELKALLRKKDKEINKRTLAFLDSHFADDHIKMIGSTIKATFPVFHSVAQQNEQVCARQQTEKEEQNIEVQGFVSVLLRTLDQSHINELKRQLLQA